MEGFALEVGVEGEVVEATIGETVTIIFCMLNSGYQVRFCERRD